MKEKIKSFTVFLLYALSIIAYIFVSKESAIYFILCAILAQLITRNNE